MHRHASGAKRHRLGSWVSWLAQEANDPSQSLVKEDDMRFVIVAALTATAFIVSPPTTVAHASPGACPFKCAAQCKREKPNHPAVRQDASTKTAIYNLRGGLGANQKPHGSSDGRYNAVFTAVVEKMKTSLTLIAKRDFGFVCRNDGFEHVRPAPSVAPGV